MSLKEKLETLKRLDDEILEVVDDEGLEDEIAQADAFKEKLHDASVAIDRRMSASASHRSGSSPTHETAVPSPAPNRAKLPKLSLRKFDGDITSWMTFWDSFESAVDKNFDLPDVDKFNYLKSLVSGTAAEAISGLTLTSANYREAVAVLKRRFGDKQRIISRHMETLLSLEVVTSQYTFKALRHLFDLVEANVRGLKSLDVSTETYGRSLTLVLLSKLPQDLRLLITRKTTEAEPTFDDLMKLFGQEIEARERAALGSCHLTRKPARDPPTVAAFMSMERAPQCCYCHQSHPSNCCGVIHDAEARKQTLRRDGRCFVCLRKRHISRNCRSGGKCSKCGGHHHASICGRDASKASAPPVSGDRSRRGDASSAPQPGLRAAAPPTSTLNPQAPEFPPRSNSMYVDVNQPVLLQTARAQIYNPLKPDVSVMPRIILDSGSQRSYLAAPVMNALGLTPEREQNLSIKTFGSEEDSTWLCQVVKVGVATRDGNNVELSLFTVPLICEPLSQQPIALCVQRCSHLVNLDLADISCGSSPMPVDILVGSDQYWKLATGRVVRGDHGPTALETKLGWVLSGPVPSGAVAEHTATNLLATHTLEIGCHLSYVQDLDAKLEKFWDLESLGIKSGEEGVYERFQNDVQFKEGRYEVCLPWKDLHSPLPDNHQLAVSRLHGLMRRLRHDPHILEEYDSTIQQQIGQGIVEVVKRPQNPVAGEVHYLPHHAVIRRDKHTTKLRIVNDASARSQGPSLNGCLFTGPKFKQNILDIILRFRVHAVALSADIEKASLMVSIAERDRDALRFLWVDNLPG